MQQEEAALRAKIQALRNVLQVTRPHSHTPHSSLAHRAWNRSTNRVWRKDDGTSMSAVVAPAASSVPRTATAAAPWKQPVRALFGGQSFV